MRLTRLEVLAAGVLLALLGSWTAVAATTASVTVTSDVGSTLNVQDSCSSSISISVVLGGYASGACAFQFGSSNDSTTTLRVSSSAGAFMSGAFTDHSGGCGALTGDTAGVKVSTTGAGVSSALGCTVSGAGTNADFLAVPDSFTNACSGTTLGMTANTCDLAVGIQETGSNATAGTYTGTLNLDVIG